MVLSFKVVPHEKLYVSTPNPIYFGNPSNPPVQDPNWTHENWLQSRFHFSFAEYRNPENMKFGVLRVINDDLIQPERGFATHGHNDMEIVTYIVHGELTHEDSMGNVETLGRGGLQYMTAGTGVEHSEHNNHPEKPLRCIQTWIVPSEYDLTPNYGSYRITDSDLQKKNQWRHLVSNIKNTSAVAPVKINQDLDCFVAELEQGVQLTHELLNNRQAYLLCIEGSITMSGHATSNETAGTQTLRKYDACEITGTGGTLVVCAVETETTEQGTALAHVMLFVMASDDRAAGRRDL